MSYCRKGWDSDVYVIGTRTELECFGAVSTEWQLAKESGVHRPILVSDWTNEGTKIIELDTKHEESEIFRTTSRIEMIEHLLAHRKAGHKVPDDAIARLTEEIDEEGDEYKCET